MYDSVNSTSDTRPLLSQPVVENPSRLYGRIGKRILDICVVILSLPVSLPLVALLALWVRLDGAPAIFQQKRIGRDGRVFRCLKLRSMVPDASERLQQHLASNPEAMREWTICQKLQKDPRVTGLGRFMRRTSLDELPQLWNVLMGDMSIVGPRPFLPEQETLYTGHHYYLLRPGITGGWQVSKDKRGGSFSDRSKHDDIYGADVTLWNDIRIMFKTVWVMIRARGV